MASRMAAYTAGARRPEVGFARLSLTDAATAGGQFRGALSERHGVEGLHPRGPQRQPAGCQAGIVWSIGGGGT